MSNHKSLSYIVLTKFEQMVDVAHDLGHKDINGAYCGYVRLPKTEHLSDKLYRISGYCALYNKQCVLLVDTYYNSNTCKLDKDVI